MKRSKLLRVTAVFFALMICFTILSRAAYQEGTALVQVSRPSNMMISHEIKTIGKVVQNQELAVTTEPDLRVDSVAVSEGQRVAGGDLLFSLDMDVLEEKILKQQQDMEKQQLQVQDAKSQKSVSGQQKVNAQAQAAENYSLSTNKAGVALSRASRNLKDAKKKLKDFQDSSGNTDQNRSVEEALEAACQEKADAYIEAEQELIQVQWKIENAVNTALSQVTGQITSDIDSEVNINSQAEEQSAGLDERDTIHTQAADILEEEAPDAGMPGGILEDEPDAGMPEGILEDPTDTPVSGSTSEDYEDLIIEDEGETRIPGMEVPGTEMPGIGIPETEIPGTEVPGMEIPDTDQLTQEELNLLEQSVRDSYSLELETARQKVERAKQEKEAADQALVSYQQERLAAAGGAAAETEQQLIEQVKAAQDAYVDASIAANEAAVISGRAVAAAGIPNASNSSDRMNEITYEQMELALQKLEKLKMSHGKVYAPSDGIVTKINIQTGEKTTDTTAILMADLSRGHSFVGELTKEQEKYIGTGDLVTLTSANGKQKYQELPVSSVRVDEENEEIYRVAVSLPADSLEIGTAVTLDFVRKSEIYPVCIPLSALHLDEKNQVYVLVTDEVDSIMGKEVKARKVGVTVLEKNEAYAALAEGTITAQQEIIVSSDKAVDDGSRVRIEE